MDIEKRNGLSRHLIKLKFSPHKNTKRCSLKRGTLTGVTVKNIRIKNKLDYTFGIPDEELTKLFQRAVKDSINEKIKKGLPIALYDKILRRAYLQFPDGRKEYIKE